MTEGEDKPLEYPTIFNSADGAIVTKTDLAAAVEFNWDTELMAAKRVSVHPAVPKVTTTKAFHITRVPSGTVTAR